ncbi:hypothetical protein E5D57_005611 [Metarhizium anisopliae]|nr:hypothetical protein E5D57_005611 [Metarhizium anisopliae]
MEDPGVKNNKTTSTERRSQSPASTPAQAHTASEGADTAAAPSANRATISGASSEEPPASESVPQTKQENGVSHETEGASSRSGGAEQPDKGEQTPPSFLRSWVSGLGSMIVVVHQLYASVPHQLIWWLCAPFSPFAN